MGRANGLDQLVDAAAALRAAGATTWPSWRSATAAGGRTSRSASARSACATCTLLPPLPKQALAGVLGAADVGLTLFAPDPDLRDQLAQQVLRLRWPPAVRWSSTSTAGCAALVEAERAGLLRAGRRPGDALAAALAALAGEPDLVAPHGRQRAAPGRARVRSRRAGRTRSARRSKRSSAATRRRRPRRIPDGFYERRGKRLLDLAARRRGPRAGARRCSPASPPPCTPRAAGPCCSCRTASAATAPCSACTSSAP